MNQVQAMMAMLGALWLTVFSATAVAVWAVSRGDRRVRFLAMAEPEGEALRVSVHLLSRYPIKDLASSWAASPDDILVEQALVTPGTSFSFDLPAASLPSRPGDRSRVVMVFPTGGEARPLVVEERLRLGWRHFDGSPTARGEVTDVAILLPAADEPRPATTTEGRPGAGRTQEDPA